MHEIMERFNVLNHISIEKQFWIRTICCMALLIPFFIPISMWMLMPTCAVWFARARKVSTAIIFVLFAANVWKSKRISLLMWALIAFEAWVVIDTVIHQGIMQPYINDAIFVLVVCALVESQSESHASELVQAFLLLYEALVMINFGSMILFPDGLYYTEMQWNSNWFLGYKNIFIYYFIPALSLELLYKHVNGKLLRFYLLLAICLVSIVWADSSTGMIAVIVATVLSLSGLYSKSICNALVSVVVKLSAFFSIVVLSVQSIFQPIFDLLGRNVSFTGRTTIWQAAIDCISQQPLIGYGNPDPAIKPEMLGMWTATTAHNFILEVLFCYGVVGLILMSVFLGIIIYELYRNRKNPYAAALNLGMICFYLVMLMEGEINNIPKFSFFFLAGQVGTMIEQSKMKLAKQ